MSAVAAAPSGYEYGNTRLRARRAQLLDRGDYRELFASGAPDRMVGVLRATAYGPDVERSIVQHDVLRRIDRSVHAHLVRSLTDLRRWYVGRPANGVDLLLGRWDLRNLLAVLRTVARPTGGSAVEELVVPVGALDRSILAELAGQPTVRAVVELMVAWDLPDRSTARAVMRSWPEYEATRQLAVLEAALAEACAASVAAAVTGWAGTDLADVLAAEVDIRQLVTALRWRADSPDRGVAVAPQDRLPPDRTEPPTVGGTVPAAVLDGIRRARQPATVLDALAAVHLPPEWWVAIERWTADGDLAALERALEQQLAAHAIGRFVRGDPLGISVPVAYVWAKECEARDVRLIARALVHGLAWAEIETELFRW